MECRNKFRNRGTAEAAPVLSTFMSQTLDVKQAVGARYSDAAQEFKPDLCCAVSYDARTLQAIPAEIIERDYGCGNPAEFVRSGETVLDLGCGGGKICYIAAQIVGASGHVIGVDINDEMLALAEKYKSQIGDSLGFHNVEFRRGEIQDLRPIVASDSVDIVLSNCVLNLVETAQKAQLFDEMFRVVKEGGRAVISDIVSDVEVPQTMRDDAELWSGCISGAYEETAFVAAFERAGFSDVKIIKRDEKPWQTVNAIEFRSVTVEAYKGDWTQLVNTCGCS